MWVPVYVLAARLVESFTYKSLTVEISACYIPWTKAKYQCSWSRLMNVICMYIYLVPTLRISWSVLRKVEIGSGTHPASYSMGIGVLSMGQRGQGVKLTTSNLYRDYECVEPYICSPLYGFIERTGTLPYVMYNTQRLQY